MQNKKNKGKWIYSVPVGPEAMAILERESKKRGRSKSQLLSEAIIEEYGDDPKTDGTERPNDLSTPGRLQKSKT